MDQATQPVATEYPTHGTTATMTLRFLGRQCGERILRCSGRNGLGYPLVRPMFVVVLGVAAKDPFEMVFVQHQQVIETLRTDGANEPLGIRVRIGGSKRRFEDL